MIESLFPLWAFFCPFCASSDSTVVSLDAFRASELALRLQTVLLVSLSAGQKVASQPTASPVNSRRKHGAFGEWTLARGLERREGQFGEEQARFSSTHRHPPDCRRRRSSPSLCGTWRLRLRPWPYDQRPRPTWPASVDASELAEGVRDRHASLRRSPRRNRPGVGSSWPGRLAPPSPVPASAQPTRTIHLCPKVSFT